MRARGLSRFVRGIAARVGFPAERVWLGGDHLGPNAWRSEPAEAAMAKAAQSWSASTSRAGFRKIHLDCSMACGDDPAPLPEASRRRARGAALRRARRAAWRECGGEAPVYVIGTEVPVPGGATEDLRELAVTTPQAARATIAAHRDAFARAGLEAAWPRVIALVVQPGVEFDHHKVIDYRPGEAQAR